MNEIWKTLPFDNTYSISNYGAVKNDRGKILTPNGGTITIREHFKFPIMVTVYNVFQREEIPLFGVVEDLPNETWKEIPDVPNYYASNFGRVKSIDRIVGKQSSFFYKGGLVAQSVNKGGYYQGRVNDRILTIHLLICKAFHPNPENKGFVNHKDGNKLNNNEWNVEWATKAENNQHAYDTGLRGRTNIIPKVQCPHCDLQIGSNMISRHIKARHNI